MPSVFSPEFWWEVWAIHLADPTIFAPFLTFGAGLLTVIVGSVVAWAALRQAKIARLRHEEQTRADLQRRITETITKAVEQLGNNEMPVRLGGIYTLERVSHESEADYWPIMEILTGFVRERARWQRHAPMLKGGMSTDVAAVLTVIMRRDAKNRERERSQGRRLDLASTDLQKAELGSVYLRESNLTLVAQLEVARLSGANLKEADLTQANLESAELRAANLEKAKLSGANLKRTYCAGANLENAGLYLADLEGADLTGANLKRADLTGANLKEAVLIGANLKEASLPKTRGLSQNQINEADGDANTTLPEGLTRPAHWRAE